MSNIPNVSLVKPQRRRETQCDFEVYGPGCEGDEYWRWCNAPAMFALQDSGGEPSDRCALHAAHDLADAVLSGIGLSREDVGLEAYARTVNGLRGWFEMKLAKGRPSIT